MICSETSIARADCSRPSRGSEASSACASRARSPSALRGTLYLAGPGKFETARGEKYAHVFDGDGMIAAFTMRDGQAAFANRFIRTPKFIAEERSGRRRYGSFGMTPPAGWLGLRRPGSFKNSINHGVVALHGRLLALNDATLPVELDPVTLATRGVHDFGGALPRTGIFASHPHWLDDPYEAYLVMTNPVGLRPSVTVWRTCGGPAAPLATHTLPHLTFIHDFAVTREHLVLSAGSLSFEWPGLARWAAELGSLASCFRWLADTPNTILLLRRSDGALLRTYEVEPSFLFHVSNAYDDDDGSVVVDVAWYQHSSIITNHLAKFLHTSSTPEEFRQAMPELRRLRLAPDGRATTTAFADIAMEFASYPEDMYAKKHRYLYPLDVGCYARLLKLDTRTGGVVAVDFGASMFGSEATFVRKPASRSEDDGWLLSCVYDSDDHHSFLSVVDALDMKEVARAHVPMHVPIRFHGTFLPGVQLG